MKLIGRGLSSFADAWFARPVSGCHAYREQVEEVHVGVDAGRGALDERQLLEDGVQLLGFGQVDPRLLFVHPV